MHICRDIPVLKANIQDGRKMMGDTMKNVTATQLRKEMLSFGKSLALRVPVFSMPVSMKLAPEAFSSSVAKKLPTSLRSFLRRQGSPLRQGSEGQAGGQAEGQAEGQDGGQVENAIL